MPLFIKPHYFLLVASLWVVAEVNGDTKSYALKNQGVKIFG